MMSDCSKSTLTRCLLAAGLIAGVSVTASAENEYPTRTIKMVVPIPPGVVADTLPRIIAEKLSARWGQPVIIENRPGAGLNLGAEFVAKAPPDGYTLLATPPGPLTISQSYYAKLGFDPGAFVPISIYADLPYVLVANPKLPAATLDEFIAYAKANPGKINYGSSGTGSGLHLTAEMLANAADIRLVHVPYQGAAPALNDLIAGHVDMMIDNLGNSLPLVRDGKLRALAVAGRARLRELPDVPALAERYPGFYSSSWFAMVAPPKTPPAIASKLSQAIAETLKQPDVAKRFGDLAITSLGITPDETAAFLKQETDRWHQVIVAAGIKPN
jgi:tripartite-type tricarboxylate transporter receptor subunit TctC